DAQRIEMLRLAIAGEPGWSVCTLETDRGGVSYTVATLQQLYTELPDAQLFFLLGADALRDVPHWKQPQEIFRRATPLGVGRSDQQQPALTPLATICGGAHQPRLIDMPAMPENSTEIRRRIAADEPIDHLVPRAVAQYIADNRCYQHA